MTEKIPIPQLVKIVIIFEYIFKIQRCIMG